MNKTVTRNSMFQALRRQYVYDVCIFYSSLQYISLSNIININLSEQLKSALDCYSLNYCQYHINICHMSTHETKNTQDTLLYKT